MSMDEFREPLPRRPFWIRALPWFAGLVLVAGVGGVLWKVIPNENPKTDTSATQNPTIVPDKAPKTVPLAKEAREVAGKFILTAVVRKNLDQAWNIVGPEIRQNLTYKQWLTGNIPVVPFTTKLGLAPMKVDYSFATHALLEVALLPPKGSKAKGDYYWLELRKVGAGGNARWLVWSWAPRVNPAIPSNPVGK
jgi:hypothetical protein